MLMHSDIESRIPHAGDMCLIEEVVDWSQDAITCRSPVPDATHPLADGGGVPVLMGVEYAAQATAIHGALLEGATPAEGGVLAKLSDVTLGAYSLDQARGALWIRAGLLARTTDGCMYTFEVTDALGQLLAGRLMVAYES